MFGRKYTFESKTTRLRRLLLSGVFLACLTIALLVSFIVYIPIYAKMQKGRADGAFYQKSPDAIAVFTGDKGRIAYAMDLLKKNPTSKLFISGVHTANSVQTLINKQSNDSAAPEINEPGVQVDLDYESKNTFENVRETVSYLKANPEIQQVLIISSDYHIMRIKLIISHFLSDSKQQFYFDSVPNTYTTWKDTKKLLKEAMKIVRTFIQLKIFREDIVLED
ncbi:YdcF family protein [Peredibacter sp. HCB2-198]|uniref:YdcF family protein n=1 Tax=Peredibacter sp. HCB2-198 TaxID=3383025 RepID=UPI0038B58CD4